MLSMREEGWAVTWGRGIQFEDRSNVKCTKKLMQDRAKRKTWKKTRRRKSKKTRQK